MKMIMILLGLAMAAATPAPAQVNPQVDPTVMAGWAGGAAAQQRLRQRQGLAGKRTARRCSYYARDPKLRCPSKRPARRSYRY